MIIQWTNSKAKRHQQITGGVFVWHGVSATNVNELQITTQYQCLVLVSNGVNGYHIVSSYTP